MKITISTLDNPEPRNYECKSFEFRSNKVNNWIKVITESEKIMIYNIAVIKAESEEQA